MTDDRAQPPTWDTVFEVFNHALGRYKPFELIGFGVAYCALLFILLPRVAFLVSSLCLLVVIMDGIHNYQQNVSQMALVQQFTMGLLLACLIFTQFYCVSKAFGLL